VLVAGVLALVLFLRTVGERRADRADVPDARAAHPEPALALRPSNAEPTEPGDAASTRTAAEPTTVELTFRVLDYESDAPIASARLRTFEDSAPGTWTADERGECVVTVPAGASRFRMHVEADGYMHLALSWWPDPSMALHLARATTLIGRLLAADTGEALPGASIALPWDDCASAKAVADLAGRYELANVPLHFPDTAVLLKATGFADQRREFELRSDEPRIEQDFRLQRGIEIHGHVVDWVSGAGIADAMVERLTTEADGAFRGWLEGDLTAPTLEVRVAAREFCELAARIDSARIGDELLFRLPRGAVVEGVVRDGSGSPVPNASVAVRRDHDELTRRRARGIAMEPPAGEPLPEGWELKPWASVSMDSTDGEGRYRIENVVPWGQVLSVSAEADGYAEASRTIEAVGGPEEVTEVDLVLEPDATVAVPETALLGTLRLNGAAFDTARGHVRWKGATRSGEDWFNRGSFFAEVEPGALTLDVEVIGLPAGLEGSHVELASVPAELFVDLRMPTRPITGRVTYADGSAASGVDLKACWCKTSVSAKTAADGSFALAVPDEDQPYEVVATVPNDGASVADVRAGATDVNLVLQVPGRLLFRAVDAVTHAPIDELDLGLGWKRREQARFHHWDVYHLVPDAEGWMEDQLPAGRLDLIAATSETDHVPLLLEDVLVPAAGEPPRLELALARGFRVHVALAEGLEPPPPEVEIVLVEEAYFEQVQALPETDSWDGGPLGNAVVRRFVYFEGQQRTCELAALGPGRYRFKVEPPDIVVEPESVTLVEGENPPIELRWRYAK